MPAFDMVVVGSGGGSDETNLSAYLIKPYDSNWEDGIVALDAGSGKGALNQIIKNKPDIFAPRSSGTTSASPVSAQIIYSFVQCFIITHAHLDHINSLIISAGSFLGPRKRIFGSEETLDDLETVFDDRIWPNLASWDEQDDSHKLLYKALPLDDEYRKVSTGISVRVMPISHGHNDTSGVYDSTAIFIRHTNKQEFLFFGDVEPDSISQKPRNINVWRAAAAKIPNILSTIFIECSWPIGRPDDLLYGHLSPTHLADELMALAVEVVTFRRLGGKAVRVSSRPTRKKLKANPLSAEDLVGALDGLRVFVTHCKDSNDALQSRPINYIITEQVKALVNPKRLGVEILAADQGMCIGI